MRKVDLVTQEVENATFEIRSGEILTVGDWSSFVGRRLDGLVHRQSEMLHLVLKSFSDADGVGKFLKDFAEGESTRGEPDLRSILFGSS